MGLPSACMCMQELMAAGGDQHIYALQKYVLNVSCVGSKLVGWFNFVTLSCCVL